MSHAMSRRTRGFSLLELVIVVVIIGIIAAIAIPHMSRGSAGAADSALSGNLAILRNAIDLYAAEHNGSFPTATGIVNQLTQYTDATGDAQAARDTTHIFGPYLRSVPPLPVGATYKGGTGISDTAAAGVGWLYTAATGTIKSNTGAGDKDSRDVLYTDY